MNEPRRSNGAQTKFERPPEIRQSKSVGRVGDLSALAAVGRKAIPVGDRGFRRKALLVKPVRRRVDFVIRLGTNIHVYYDSKWRNILETARTLKPPGRVTRKEGKAHARRCEVVAFRVHETMCENLKRDLHMDEFMVRDRLAVEWLLWAAAMSYMVLIALLLGTARKPTLLARYAQGTA